MYIILNLILSFCVVILSGVSYIYIKNYNRIRQKYDDLFCEFPGCTNLKYFQFKGCTQHFQPSIEGIDKTDRPRFQPKPGE